MLGEPLAGAINAARQRQAASGVKKSRVVYLSPQGRLLTHPVVKELVAQQDEGLILLAGRYEGIDERLIRQYVDEEISIGDYVLSGGELAAMVLIDSLVRQLPGVLVMRNQPSRIRSCKACWTVHTTRGRKCLMVKPCPRCYCLAIMRIYSAGGFSSRWAGRGCAGRIYWPSVI